jgi:hypothetical protein
METGETVGIAFIEVQAPASPGGPFVVQWTAKVKAVVKVAGWVIHNNTPSPVKVELSNFRPASSPGAGGSSAQLPTTFEWFTSNPTSPIPHDGHAVIVGRFGQLGTGTYDYDVLVDGAHAVDPQLEI